MHSIMASLKLGQDVANDRAKRWTAAHIVTNLIPYT